MKERPSFEDIYAKHVSELARRSECKRLSVGCVILSEDFRYVFGAGYNGGASGLPPACTGEVGACGCNHAEDNAVTNCTAPRSERKVVIVTHMPCLACATRFVNLGGVRRVLWLADYRITTGQRLLVRAGIEARSLADFHAARAPREPPPSPVAPATSPEDTDGDGVGPLDTPLFRLGLRTEVVLNFKARNVRTVRELVRMTRNEVADVPGVGRGALGMIETHLSSLGLSFGMKDTP